MSEFTEEFIIKYLDNTLSEGDEKLLFKWLQSSEKNREVFLTCKKIYASGKIRHYSDPLHLNQALQNFNNRTQLIQRHQKRNLVIHISKYAAILIIALAIPALIWFIVRERPVELVTVQVNSSEPVKTVVLSDGTKIWVNNGSSITYPVKFGRDNRNVTLIGEAFFEVKTDSLRPFIVKTNAMLVKVFGTSFNVNTNTVDSTVKTTLVSGHVSILDLGGKNLARLSPGQLASFHTYNNRLYLKEVNTDLYTLWRKGLLVFEKASLSEITGKIEELYNVRITINHQNRMQNKINFVFRKTYPLDTVMEMLEFVAPIRYKKFDNQIYVNFR